MTQQPQSVTQRLRDFMKCGQCRKEHKKCLPRDRDWTGQREKCTRCQGLGHPCGPSTRKRKSVAATSNANLSTSQLIPAETMNSHEGLACLVLNLAVIISTYEILVSRSLLLDRGISGTTSEIVIGGESETLNNAIRQNHLAFRIATLSVKNWLENVRGVEKELLGMKMAHFDAQHCDLRNIKSFSAAQAYVERRDRRIAYMSRDTAEARILSCTSRVFCDCHADSCISLERLHPKSEDYVDLELHMRKLFIEIQEVDNEDSVPMLIRPLRSSPHGLNAFSASHIAYLNQDPEIALRLWKRPINHAHDVDVLGRPFAHIVAASRDRDTLEEIVKHAPDAFKHIDLGKLDLGNDPNDQAIQALLCGVRVHPAPNLLYCPQQVPTPLDLMRHMDRSKYPNWRATIHNNSFLNSGPQESLFDIDKLQHYFLQTQTRTSMNMGDSLSFSQGLPIGLNPLYGSDFAYGQSNTIQPTNGQVQPIQANNCYPLPFDPQLSLDYNCDGFNHYDPSGE